MMAAATGGSDGGHKRRSQSVRIERGLHQHVDEAGADAGHQKIIPEAARSPGALEIHAEHPEEEHVEQQMEQAAVEKNVGKRLPEPQAVCHRARHQAKFQYQQVRRVRQEQSQHRLNQKHARA
jgi:hypothetical protein